MAAFSSGRPGNCIYLVTYLRHSRENENPESPTFLDSHFRGNDGFNLRLPGVKSRPGPPLDYGRALPHGGGVAVLVLALHLHRYLRSLLNRLLVNDRAGDG